jgi:hypothetical protein
MIKHLCYKCKEEISFNYNSYGLIKFNIMNYHREINLYKTHLTEFIENYLPEDESLKLQIK